MLHTLSLPYSAHSSVQSLNLLFSAGRREVVIPAGLVIDKRFKMTRNGKAVFVG